MRFVEAYATEDGVRQTGRLLAHEIGVPAIGADVGAALQVLAAVRQGRAIVEVGTGTGVSGLWLLQGMRPDGVLTTIAPSAAQQRIARRLFVEAGIAANRVRLIAGQAQQVLPRLADMAYDLLFLNATPTESVTCLGAAERLLRPGGVLAVHNVLDATITDPTVQDPHTVALRELLRSVRESPQWSAALLPVGNGLLAAVRVGD